MIFSCQVEMPGEATVDAWTVAGLKACELAPDLPPDSCSLATTCDGSSPVAVPEAAVAAGSQYRRDLLLSFRSLLPVQPAGCTLPCLVPAEVVWEPWRRVPRRRGRRAEPRLPEGEEPVADEAPQTPEVTGTEVPPDLPAQPAPAAEVHFHAASVRSKGRRPQPAARAVCTSHARAWPCVRRAPQPEPLE
ncbi:DNAH7 [Symbiodinium natans]|uniref:DNAH7 protein n=1 Tax=Symbiodinium natans TaxID=878477 RepID=A0A812V3J9_9DINO|nr:DNAH7 [Symbiodinium natans]